MNEIFIYVLAIAAKRYGVLVHAVCVLSNHVHLILTDVDGRLPAFMQYLDSLVARAVNVSLGRFEAFWATDGSYSAVEPLDPADVLAKTAYVLANPVAAGLVRRASEWPGLWTAPEQIGVETLSARRPRVFFDPASHLPETVELELSVPPSFAATEFRSLLAEAVRELEQAHARERTAQGRGFLGVVRVLAENPLASPPTRPARFELKPRIAARDKWKRIEGILRIKDFERDYRRARRDMLSGVRDVIFPAGTYLLRILFGVRCAGAA